MGIVRAESYSVRAIFARVQRPNALLIDRLRPLTYFVDHVLTRDEVGQGEPLGYIVAGSVTLVRMKVNDRSVLVFADAGWEAVYLNVIHELQGSGRSSEEAKGLDFQAMESTVAELIRACNFKPLDAEVADPFIRERCCELEQCFSRPFPLGSESLHLYIVALQGMGYDPFVRTSQKRIH